LHRLANRTKLEIDDRCAVTIMVLDNRFRQKIQELYGNRATFFRVSNLRDLDRYNQSHRGLIVSAAVRHYGPYPGFWQRAAELPYPLSWNRNSYFIPNHRIYWV
jgi:hypothetical protein